MVWDTAASFPSVDLPENFFDNVIATRIGRLLVIIHKGKMEIGITIYEYPPSRAIEMYHSSYPSDRVDDSKIYRYLRKLVTCDFLRGDSKVVHVYKEMDKPIMIQGQMPSIMIYNKLDEKIPPLSIINGTCVERGEATNKMYHVTDRGKKFMDIFIERHRGIE